MPEVEFLRLLGASNPMLDDFIEHVANRGLGRYRDIIQTGGKAGESYFHHVLTLVLTADQLREAVSVDDAEARCLALACVVHDINKVPPYSQARDRYVNIATAEHAERELRLVGVDDFFPSWREYIDDITGIARLHQVHDAVTNVGLNLNRSSRYRLGWERVRFLGELMQAVDVLALSGTLDEQRHKEQFLAHLNAVLDGRRYHIVRHRLAEQGGLLTNVIHNVVVEYLKSERRWIPLLFFPAGVAYLAPRGDDSAWTATDTQAIATAVAMKLAAIQREEIRSLVRRAPVGIKVDAAALEAGATPEQIVDLIQGLIRNTLQRQGLAAEREADIRADLAFAVEGGPSVAATEPARRLLATETIISADADALLRADLAAACRNFLEDHLRAELAAQKRDAWTEVYRLCELPQENWPGYQMVQAFRRPFAFAAEIRPSLDEMSARMVELLSELMPDSPHAASRGWVASYLSLALDVEGGSTELRDFGSQLRRYVEAHPRQCCHCCGAESPEEWMSANAPTHVGVQAFSNRLPGGSPREPKRNICPVCRTQFILERLASAGRPRDSKRTTFYLHLFPHGFYTDGLLRALRAEVQSLLQQDAGAIFLNARRFFREWRDGADTGVPFSRAKVNGVALVRMSELIGNVPMFSLHAPGANYTEQCVAALEQAVLLARFLGCRVLLSRMAIPSVGAETVDGIVVDGFPSTLRWLTGDGGPDSPVAAATADILGRLRDLHGLEELLLVVGDDSNVVASLAVAAAADPMLMYSEVNRLIERRIRSPRSRTADPDRLAIYLAQQAAPNLRRLVKENAIMQELQALAAYHAQHRSLQRGLGGRMSFARNAILKPLDTMLAALEANPNDEDRDLVLHACKDRVFEYLNRVAAGRFPPGRRARGDVNAYVDLFFDGLLRRAHKDDLNALLRREKLIRDAYLAYFREALGEEAQVQQTDDDPDLEDD